MTETEQDEPVVNVCDFGAVADGVTDIRPALRSAAAALPDGGTIYIPPGAYFVSQEVSEHEPKVIISRGTVVNPTAAAKITGRHPSENVTWFKNQESGGA